MDEAQSTPPNRNQQGRYGLDGATGQPPGISRGCFQKISTFDLDPDAMEFSFTAQNSTLVASMKPFLPLIVLLMADLGWLRGATDSAFIEEANRQLREATAGETAGVAVLVARDGQVVFQGGFGFADLAQKLPITTDTKFRIGSVTKQFTAAAILRLAEAGKLALTDPLSKHLPGFPRGDEITLRHLLTHTSGLHSFTDDPDFIKRVGTRIEPVELMAKIKLAPLDFLPGTKFHYSNSGYFLLGEIVARVSGRPLGDFFRETFFEPLGMKNTGLYVNATPPQGIALGYGFKSGTWERALDWDMSWAGGAGALYSTVGDLFLWTEALFNGRVLSDASFQAAITPVALPATEDAMKYGYGLGRFEHRRLPVIGHGGGLSGWSSDLIRFPEQRCTVVVLSNALPPSPGLVAGTLSRKLAETLLEADIKKLPPMEVDASADPKTFADYVGRYDYKTAIMTVSLAGAELHAQITGQPEFQIFPKAKDRFFWKVVDAEVEFVRDDQGKVVAARHSQNGNVMRAARLTDRDLMLTAEQLDRFVGKYRYGPTALLTVSRDGAQLFAQLTGQPRFPIFPKSDHEFEWRMVAASVAFKDGDDGKVAKAVHTQNGRTFDAPKTE